MEIIEALMTRRSIRKFKEGQISQEDIKTIIKAGCQAPSACNCQPWQFVVIRNKNTFEKITQFHPHTRMLAKADTCIVVCGDKEKESMTGFLLEDCSAAIENMLLAVHGLGLGAVWCGLYPNVDNAEKMSVLLHIPDHIIPVGMIVIGCKGEEKAPEDRFDENRVHFEDWQGTDNN